MVCCLHETGCQLAPSRDWQDSLHLLILHWCSQVKCSTIQWGIVQPLAIGFINIINSLARVVAPAKVMSPQRHHYSWDCPFNGSQLNCHKRGGTGKLSYSSSSVSRRHHLSWRHHFNWGHSCIGSQLNCDRGSGTGKFSNSRAWAILATLAGATSIYL